MLKVRNVSVAYGHITALNKINLDVFQGEIIVLIGANGAGKTSLMETVLGAHVPENGEIEFKGKTIQGISTDKNVRQGLFLVPEGRGVFSTMSVLDNLLLGAHHNRRKTPEKLELVFDYFPILSERQTQIAGTLSGGERRMLALARALMSSPDMILVDEPSLGLAPLVVNDIFKILTRLNREGYSILLSEQNIHKALKIAHRGYVLETGRIVKSGTAENLLNDPAVKEAYLGV